MQSADIKTPNIAVIIPCFNEEQTIRKVVLDAREALPEAQVFVYDNASTDRTSSEAKSAGAHVVHCPLRGKGHVLRQAFAEVEADFYVLVDGDDTYPMNESGEILRLVAERGNAMAIGTRFERAEAGSFRRFHVMGNLIFSRMVSFLFQQQITDMLSGFRILSRELIDQLCLRSTGFEIETDLTLQAISKQFAVAEHPVAYRPRPSGSHSKLNTYRDGYFILKFIFKLMREYRPLPFFTFAALLCVG